MVSLRDYQIQAIRNVLDEWRDGKRSTLLVQATGTGKTVVFSELTRQLIEQGKNVLILAHRDELLEQARDKLLACSGVLSVLEKADSHSAGSLCAVTVGSVQTLCSKKRLEEFDPEHFDVIIIDEAHHTLSKSYLNILDYFKKAKVLGVTATPFRGDKKNLAKVYESTAFEYSLLSAISDGYLCPIQAKLIPLDIDLSQVAIRTGDYDVKGLSSALDPYLNAIADVMVDECKNKKVVVFLPLIETSKHFKEILTSKGFKAEEVNGQTPNRKEILRDFENGKIDVLCNAMLLTEGWDCPSVDCIVNLRPTKSTALFTQIVGRGTRLYPNKENLLLLDFLWLTTQHDLCRPANLVAETKEELDIINQSLKDGQEKDLSELKECAIEQVKINREEALKKRIEENRKKKSKLVDPVAYAVSLHAVDLMDYEPIHQWETDPVTDKQRQVLLNNSLDPELVTCKGMAVRVIRRLAERGRMGLATPKQIRLLERFGFKELMTMKKSDATKLVGMLINSNFKPNSLFYEQRERWNRRGTIN